MFVIRRQRYLRRKTSRYNDIELVVFFNVVFLKIVFVTQQKILARILYFAVK